VLIAPFCLAMLVGIYLRRHSCRACTGRRPPFWLAAAEACPTNYVHATVPIEIDARIASLAQQILSSSNLLELIERFKALLRQRL